MRYHLTCIWMFIIKNMINVDKDIEKRKHWEYKLVLRKGLADGLHPDASFSRV